MQVQTIDNTNFKARFPEKDIEKLLNSTSKLPHPELRMPHLYTMLEVIDNLPGKTARLKKKKDVFGAYYCVSIDSKKDMGRSRTFLGETSPALALYSACLRTLKEASANKFDNTAAERTLKSMASKNKNATADTIRQLSLNA